MGDLAGCHTKFPQSVYISNKIDLIRMCLRIRKQWQVRMGNPIRMPCDPLMNTINALHTQATQYSIRGARKPERKRFWNLDAITFDASSFSRLYIIILVVATCMYACSVFFSSFFSLFFTFSLLLLLLLFVILFLVP